MIFFLASPPVRSFEQVKTIYQLYSKGKITTTSKSKSLRGISSIPDLKGSFFKPFRALDDDTLYELLHDVATTSCTFVAAVAKCKDIKMLQKIQAAFIKITNCGDWDLAVERYPNFTTIEMLEPYKKLSFKKNAPEKFVRFCQRAMKCKDLSNSSKDHDSHYSIVHQHCIGVMWKQPLFGVAPHMMNLEDLNSCTGFSLSILDLSYCSCADKVLYGISVAVKYTTLYACILTISW